MSLDSFLVFGINNAKAIDFSGYSFGEYEHCTVEEEGGVKYLCSETDVLGDETFFTEYDETEYELKMFMVRKDPAKAEGEYLVVIEKAKNPQPGQEEEYRARLSEYLLDPWNYAKVYKSEMMNVRDNRNPLVAVEDVDAVIKYYRRLQKIVEEEEQELCYTYLYKVYDYDEHDFPVLDAYGEQRTNYDGSPMVEHRKPKDKAEADKYGIKPEWLPSRPWMKDTSDEEYWYNEDIVKSVKLGDLLGETDGFGGYRWEVPYIFTLATLAYIATMNYENWDDDLAKSSGMLVDPLLSSDNYYITDEQLLKVLDAYNYHFDWHFTYEKWPDYEELLEDYLNTDKFEMLPNKPMKILQYEDMEKYSYKLDKAEIGVEVEEEPEIGTRAWIDKQPENAPKTISNIFEYVEYVYEDVDDGYGKQKCVGRDRYINATAWYKFMMEMTHNQFDWDEFEECLSQYIASPPALELFELLKETYEEQGGSDGMIQVANLEIEDALGEELPHYDVRLGEDLTISDAEAPEGWVPTDMPVDLWEYNGPILEPTEFIEMIAQYAIAEAQSRGTWVLPSVCIAQACLETGMGKSKRMMNSNAVFGIKANKAWVDAAKYGGLVYSSKTKECYDGSTYVSITDTFRAYNSIKDSISDYYDLITKSSRYSGAVNETDAAKAISAIKAGGYATSPTYVQSIMNIINKYNLTQYDP